MVCGMFSFIYYLSQAAIPPNFYICTSCYVFVSSHGSPGTIEAYRRWHDMICHDGWTCVLPKNMIKITSNNTDHNINNKIKVILRLALCSAKNVIKITIMIIIMGKFNSNV